MNDRRRLLAAAAALGVLAGGVVVGTAGSAAAASSTWTQSGDITIQGAETLTAEGGPARIPATGESGPAGIYPWSISVPDIGAVTDVNVTLTDFAHSTYADTDVMLVGPNGAQVMLTSDLGGPRVTNAPGVTLTFDDEATDTVPVTERPVGSYRPSNNGGYDSFPGIDAVDAGTSLSVFDGTSAQGDWKLYVVDDDFGDTGSLGGWALTFTTDSAVSPYPSSVQVSGLTEVLDVDVVLTGVDHPSMADLDVLLVGPDGEQAVVLSDAGGDLPVDMVDLELDDEAAAAAPQDVALTSGSWRPVNYGSDPDVFQAPAPELASGVGSALSVFDGTDPNGTWSLYVVGDAAAEMDGMIDSWSLVITTDEVAPAGSVSINGAAVSTSTAAVTLDLTASDPDPDASGVEQMRFSNDGASWSAWQPYAASASWTLGSGDGVKTVSAQFRDASGNISATVSDTIMLVTPAGPAPVPGPRDVVSPTWVRFAPVKGAKRVARGRDIVVGVSEDLDPVTVNRATVYLKRRGSQVRVKASLAYDRVTKLISIDPVKKLRAGANYRVTITTGVHDLAGNRFDGKTTVFGFQNHRWNFTTTD